MHSFGKYRNAELNSSSEKIFLKVCIKIIPIKNHSENQLKLENKKLVRSKITSKSIRKKNCNELKINRLWKGLIWTEINFIFFTNKRHPKTLLMRLGNTKLAMNNLMRFQLPILGCLVFFMIPYFMLAQNGSGKYNSSYSVSSQTIKNTEEMIRCYTMQMDSIRCS